MTHLREMAHGGKEEKRNGERRKGGKEKIKQSFAPILCAPQFLHDPASYACCLIITTSHPFTESRCRFLADDNRKIDRVYRYIQLKFYTLICLVAFYVFNVYDVLPVYPEK